MILFRVVKDVIGYFSGAIVRIFGLNDDAYPETGVQPYQGEPSPKKRPSDL